LNVPDEEDSKIVARSRQQSCPVFVFRCGVVLDRQGSGPNKDVGACDDVGCGTIGVAQQLNARSVAGGCNISPLGLG
jgi:hypothetical protein